MENREFNYTYSAPTEEERKEIESIRRQYTGGEKKEMTAMERLRYLDRKVKNLATITGLVLGVVGCLIFGFGLTCILEWSQMAFGIVMMVVGAIPMAIAYPLYKTVLKRSKAKYGAEIVKLCEEALQQ